RLGDARGHDITLFASRAGCTKAGSGKTSACQEALARRSSAPWPASRTTGERSNLIPPLKQRINEQIRVPQLRVIAADGQQLGILATDAALAAAREAGLDLVEVSPLEQPPVARIMDFGKFKYEKAKRQHKS